MGCDSTESLVLGEGGGTSGKSSQKSATFGPSAEELVADGQSGG